MTRADAGTASVMFGRQNSKKDLQGGRGKQSTKKTGCFAALSRCDLDGCFAAMLGMPSTSDTGGQEYGAREALKELRAHCMPWASMPEARQKSARMLVAIATMPKEELGWVNQDSYVACALPSNDDGSTPFLFGVCDGHGKCGHEASAHVVERLPKHLVLQGTDPFVDPATAFHDAIKVVDDDIYRALGEDVEFSGTTSATVIIDRQKHVLHCANVGDSRVVLGRYISSSRKWEAYPLTADSKPGLEEERARIEMMGGYVAAFQDCGFDIGPERVWDSPALQKPGLAVSRSLGDGCARSCGVIADPVVSKHNLREDDRIILLGSDGLWDSLGNQQAINIAGKFVNNPQIGVKALIEAVRRAERGYFVDDTTVMMVVLLP